MIAPLTKFIAWYFLQVVWMLPSFRKCARCDSKLTEAIELLVEAEQTEELWQKWKQPEIWRLPHGHISLALLPGLTGRVLRWLTPRLDGSFNHSENI